jgi:hypothetical protein
MLSSVMLEMSEDTKTPSPLCQGFLVSSVCDATGRRHKAGKRRGTKQHYSLLKYLLSRILLQYLVFLHLYS